MGAPGRGGAGHRGPAFWGNLGTTADNTVLYCRDLLREWILCSHHTHTLAHRHREVMAALVTLTVGSFHSL